MKPTIEQLEQRLAELSADLNQLKQDEPKDGEWFECKTFPFTHSNIVKFKSKGDRVYNYYFRIDVNGNMHENDWCIPFDSNARKITPSEALPYFKAYFEKQGFKEGMKFKSAASGDEYVFGKVRNAKLVEFYFYGDYYGCLFDNATNTFATLVKEEKLEPLEVGDVLVVADSEVLEITLKNTELKETVSLYHSEIEQLYQYSLKAQGK